MPVRHVISFPELVAASRSHCRGAVTACRVFHGACTINNPNPNPCVTLSLHPQSNKPKSGEGYAGTSGEADAHDRLLPVKEVDTEVKKKKKRDRKINKKLKMYYEAVFFFFRRWTGSVLFVGGVYRYDT